MKKIISAAAMIATLATAAAAHPPKSVSIDVNTSGRLAVSVSHGVNDPVKHYVYQITVYVDDALRTQRDFPKQEGAEGIDTVFELGELKAGAKVRVDAFCVIMGSASATAVVQ